MTEAEMMKRVHDMLLNLTHRFGRVEAHIERHDVEIIALGHRVAKGEAKAEDTGRHELDKLEKELERRRAGEQESRTWWARHWVAVVLAMSVVLLSTGCSVAGTLVLRKVFGV